MRLVLLGAPGSGKGTQGEALAAHYRVPHIASGELLRDQAARGSKLGRQIAHHLARGDLVPGDLVFAVVVEAVAAVGSAGYVMDGFPRTVAQAEKAHALAAPAGVAAEAVILLDLSDAVARERLAGRREGRSDDADPAVTERRLQLYNEQTRPLIDYYRRRGILITVDASRPPGEVTAAVLAALADRVRDAGPTVGT